MWQTVTDFNFSTHLQTHVSLLSSNLSSTLSPFVTPSLFYCMRLSHLFHKSFPLYVWPFFLHFFCSSVVHLRFIPSLLFYFDVFCWTNVGTRYFWTHITCLHVSGIVGTRRLPSCKFRSIRYTRLLSSCVEVCMLYVAFALAARKKNLTLHFWRTITYTITAE